MNEQDNENINTSLLQGEVSPQAIVLPSGIIRPTGGIIRPTGGLTGILPPTGGLTGILPPTGIIPTGIRPTGILPSGGYYQPTPFKKFIYQPKGSSSFITYDWQYNGQRVLKAYIKDDNIEPTVLGGGLLAQLIIEKNKGRYFYVYSPKYEIYIGGLSGGPFSVAYNNSTICDMFISYYADQDNFYDETLNYTTDYLSAETPLIIYNDRLPYTTNKITITGTTYTGWWFGDLVDNDRDTWTIDLGANWSGLEYKASYDIAVKPDYPFRQEYLSTNGWIDKFTISIGKLPLFLDGNTVMSDYNNYQVSFSLGSEANYSQNWTLELNKNFLHQDRFIKVSRSNYNINWHLSRNYTYYSEDMLYKQVYCTFRYISYLYDSDYETLHSFIESKGSQWCSTGGSTSWTGQKNTITKDDSAPFYILLGTNRLMPLRVSSATVNRNKITYRVYNDNACSVSFKYLSYINESLLNNSQSVQGIDDLKWSPSQLSSSHSSGMQWSTTTIGDLSYKTITVNLNTTLNLTAYANAAIIIWWNTIDPSDTTLNENRDGIQYIFCNPSTQSRGYYSYYSIASMNKWVPISNANTFPFDTLLTSAGANTLMYHYQYSNRYTLSWATSLYRESSSPSITVSKITNNGIRVTVTNSSSRYSAVLFVRPVIDTSTGDEWPSALGWAKMVGCGERTSLNCYNIPTKKVEILFDWGCYSVGKEYNL